MLTSTSKPEKNPVTSERGVTRQGFLLGSSNQRDIHCFRAEDQPQINIPQRYVWQTPHGMNWGHSGTDAQNFAYNVLALFIVREEAEFRHQRFLWEVVASMPWDGGTITARSVRTWIKLDRHLQKFWRPTPEVANAEG